MTTGNNRLKSSGVIKKAQTTNQTKSLHLTITTLKNITITNERWKVEGGRWKEYFTNWLKNHCDIDKPHRQ